MVGLRVRAAFALEHPPHPERRVAALRPRAQPLAQLGLWLGPLLSAWLVRLVRFVVLAVVGGTDLRLVLDYHLLLLAALLLGIVRVFEVDNMVHPGCPDYLVKPLEVVTEHVSVGEFSAYQYLRFLVGRLCLIFWLAVIAHRQIT